MSFRHFIASIGLFICALYLGGCTTTSPPQTAPISSPQQTYPGPNNPPYNSPYNSNDGAQTIPVTPFGDSSYETGQNAPDIYHLPQALIEAEEFDALYGWKQTDKKAAFTAFTRSCARWEKLTDSKDLHSRHEEFGRVSDWQDSCSAAKGVNAYDENAVTNFFTREFIPVRMIHGQKDGLLTGYYQPEIEVKRNPETGFTEPVLAEPWHEETLRKPRRDINVASGRVIAYGRPADVFFMQVQGSGILRFEDGRRVRAAYAANNGHPYTSIGRVLIQRGELDPDRASKKDIEDWMNRAGYEKTRDLLHENARYIFFREEAFEPGIGPKGASGVPLSDMGSLAVDPSYYPYGLPVWLETKLPQRGGDYRGQDTGLLVITQDTGKAIRGAYRGDIYFGSGQEAGDKAGVMKHPATWVVLLPVQLARLITPVS